MQKMRQTIIILLYFYCGVVFGQDLQLNCEDTKIPCYNGNKSHFKMVIYTPYQEVDTNTIPQEIRDKNRKYLYDRVGVTFYNKLQYYSCQTIDFKKSRQLKKERGFTSKKLADKRVKYAFQYYFVIQDSMRYYLSTVYDKDGNLISEHQLPDIAKNETWDNIIDVCQAKQVAETDEKYKGKLEGITLQFSAEYNSFVWEVEKPEIRKGKEITRPFVIIHAQTGKIIGHRTEKGIIVCGLPAF